MSLSVNELNQFTGTRNYYRHWFARNLVYTDGVKYLAEEGSAYWLLDAIASYQADDRVKKNAELRDMQFWTLRVEDKRGTLTCVEDSDRSPAIRQEIEFTDFPLDEVELWVERGSIDGVREVYVMMLPSER